MKRRVLVITIVITLALMGAGYWYYSTYISRIPENVIEASGMIEVTEITLSAEVGGKIKALPLEEGDEVQKGELLAQIDDQLLKEQLKVAQAQLEVAQANLDLARFGYEQKLKTAQANLSQAQRVKDSTATYNHFIYYEEPLSITKTTQSSKTSTTTKTETDLGTQKSRSTSRSSASSQSLSLAGEGQKQAVRVQLEQALGAYELAQTQLELAQSSQVEIEVAHKALEQAQASLDLVKAQLSYAQLLSPKEGVVLVKMAEEGEYVGPGFPLLILGDLDQVRLKIYVAEDRYGQVQLGQEAEVRVDSYPEEIFRGKVSKIADQAEFTPTNIQTKEKRVETVYAITISLDNPEHKLKPGMPADASLRVGS